MKLRRSVSLAVALVAMPPLRAQVPAPKVIPNEPTCPKCTINVQNVVTLGTEDGAGSLNGKPMSVNVDSRGRYWVFEELEPPTVFSPTGGVLQMVGRKGRGPGEFQAANNGIVVGDSMLVFDWMEMRATMIGPDLKAGRTIRIRSGLYNELVVLSWPTLLVSRGYFNDSKPANSTMHRVSLSGNEMQLLGSFGPRGTGGSMGNMDVQQLIGRANDGIWSAYWNRPQFTRWDRSGVPQLTLMRQFDWFSQEMKSSLGTPSTPPKPMTAAIHEDTDGLVWLFIHSPAPTWKAGWEAPPTRFPGGGTEYAMRSMGWDKLFRTYVEVIDPVQARVVASTTINGYVFETLPDRRAALYKVDDNGIPRVQIVALSLGGR